MQSQKVMELRGFSLLWISLVAETSFALPTSDALKRGPGILTHASFLASHSSSTDVDLINKHRSIHTSDSNMHSGVADLLAWVVAGTHDEAAVQLPAADDSRGGGCRHDAVLADNDLSVVHIPQHQRVLACPGLTITSACAQFGESIMRAPWAANLPC